MEFGVGERINQFMATLQPTRARADYDYLIKLLLIGDSVLGLTSDFTKSIQPLVGSVFWRRLRLLLWRIRFEIALRWIRSFRIFFCLDGVSWILCVKNGLIVRIALKTIYQAKIPILFSMMIEEN